MFVPRSVSVKHVKKNTRTVQPKPQSWPTKGIQQTNPTTHNNTAKPSTAISTSVQQDRQTELGSDEPGSAIEIDSSTSLKEEFSNDGCEQGSSVSKEEDEDEPIVSFSKNQRWPEEGEPACVMCGRYGEYICDQTDSDVCSLECKAKHLTLVHHQKQYLDPDQSSSPEESRATVQVNSLSETQNLYKEHVTLSQLSNEQVEEVRKQLGITVRGTDVPKPILEFFHCGFNDTVSANMSVVKYDMPTAVQMQVLPAGMMGRDVMAAAPTGSGKTAAFLLPVVLNVFRTVSSAIGGRDPRWTHPLALILAPTRELCMQVEDQAKQLMKGLPHMRTALLVGGLPLPPQVHRLQQGVQVLVATPGRLLDILHRKDVSLECVEVLVVDELDTMLHLGFREQVLEIIDSLPSQRQTMMFSATIPQPIETLASSILNNPVYVLVGQASTPSPSVKQTILWVEENSKKRMLFTILQDPKHYQPPVLVFVDSRMGADLLADAIHTKCNVRALSMHGDKPQSERSAALNSLLKGEVDVVVATGVLGRGLDLCRVRLVIVFDMPPSVNEYIHQIGRAGRLGSSGRAMAFINNNNKGLFLDLFDTLHPLHMQMPSQLVNSPHLQQQRERRKRTQRARENVETSSRTEQHGEKWAQQKHSNAAYMQRQRAKRGREQEGSKAKHHKKY
ncbi:probable ATP-dependent RNA helicase DDX59 [Branchiostoma floridae]|uniref:Probable ATP-dependent RNA helicase DDX59 n=1 Tax=Branchiostoma floridae TaxID=7739 RepID=A0A9J7HT36_BRAFL|nr:probable ATP-dependent RNA helicase DDX59 [Branchiostoma floridae]